MRFITAVVDNESVIYRQLFGFYIVDRECRGLHAKRSQRMFERLIEAGDVCHAQVRCNSRVGIDHWNFSGSDHLIRVGEV